MRWCCSCTRDPHRRNDWLLHHASQRRIYTSARTRQRPGRRRRRPTIVGRKAELGNRPCTLLRVDCPAMIDTMGAWPASPKAPASGTLRMTLPPVGHPAAISRTSSTLPAFSAASSFQCPERRSVFLGVSASHVDRKTNCHTSQSHSPPRTKWNVQDQKRRRCQSFFGLPLHHNRIDNTPVHPIQFGASNVANAGIACGISSRFQQQSALAMTRTVEIEGEKVTITMRDGARFVRTVLALAKFRRLFGSEPTAQSDA